jgi:hypothetical protein
MIQDPWLLIRRYLTMVQDPLAPITRELIMAQVSLLPITRVLTMTRIHEHQSEYVDRIMLQDQFVPITTDSIMAQKPLLPITIDPTRAQDPLLPITRYLILARNPLWATLKRFYQDTGSFSTKQKEILSWHRIHYCPAQEIYMYMAQDPLIQISRDLVMLQDPLIQNHKISDHCVHDHVMPKSVFGSMSMFVIIRGGHSANEFR